MVNYENSQNMTTIVEKINFVIHWLIVKLVIKIMHMLLTLLKWTLKYHDLYLKVNVLLLASVFETVRKESVNPFEFDPHYFSFPDYSW